MECEICGREDGGIIALIEGARLHVCESCARGGKILHVEPEAYSSKQGAGPGTGGGSGAAGGARSPGAQHTMEKDEFELVDSYGVKIKAARERLGLPLAVLGERIAEKESFLERIEKETAKPSDPLAKKLEKELGITILEQASSMPFQTGGKPGKDITLGDVIEIVRKKKK